MCFGVSSLDALGWGRADGVLCSANVLRAAYGRSSSLISLRKAHHRRSLPSQRLISQHNATCTGRMPMGCLCSEIKEAPQAGDIRERGYPLASAPAHPQGNQI